MSAGVRGQPNLQRQITQLDGDIIVRMTPADGKSNYGTANAVA